MINAATAPGASPRKLSLVSRPIAMTAPIAAASLFVRPWRKARASRIEERGRYGEQHRVRVDGAGHEPEQWRERDAKAPDRPRPWSARERFAYEQERKEGGEPAEQGRQQTHELETVEQRPPRADSAEVVGDRLERVVERWLIGGGPGSRPSPFW